MTRFQVPQFIEVKDKIIGPLTLKQFLYLVGGGAAIFLLYISLPFFLFVIFAAPVGSFATALAFYKINEKPFIEVVENAIRHYTRKRIYTWRKRENTIKREFFAPAEAKKRQPSGQVPALTKSKLEDLSWSLDVKRGSEQK